MSKQHVRGASLVCDEGRHSVCDHTCGVGYALLKADIDAAFRRHETEQSDSMVDVLAELAWTGTGPRPLVVPRLARLGGRFAIRGLHFLRDLSEDVDDEDDGKDEKGPSA